MTGNLMYLVCTHHPDRMDALVIGSRGQSANGRGLPYTSMLTQNSALQKFLDKHARCGGGFDHYTIAFDAGKDQDLPKPVASAVARAVTEAQIEPSSAKIIPLPLVHTKLDPDKPVLVSDEKGVHQ